MSLFPENNEEMTIVHRTMELNKRRKKIFPLEGDGGVVVVSGMEIY
jgi:hypothetical protein